MIIQNFNVMQINVFVLNDWNLCKFRDRVLFISFTYLLGVKSKKCSLLILNKPFKISNYIWIWENKFLDNKTEILSLFDSVLFSLSTVQTSENSWV